MSSLLLLLFPLCVSGLRVLESGSLATMGRGLARAKRQVVWDPDFNWFFGKDAEYVAPGGVHTQTQVETMECLYNYLEYIEKLGIKPSGEHDALMNNHLFDSSVNTQRLCFGYNKMINCILGAGKEGQRNGMEMMETNPLFTTIRGVDWLCEKPQKRYRALNKHRACYSKVDGQVRSSCDRKCKTNDRRFPGVAALALSDANREQRIREGDEAAFERSQASAKQGIELLCDKAKCLLNCERQIMRRSCRSDIGASLFKLRFYKETLFRAKAEGDSRFIWDGVNFNGYWPPQCRDIQTMSVF